MDEFIRLTKYKRNYANWILRNYGREIFTCIDGQWVKIIVGKARKEEPRKRPRKYDDKVLKALKKIWYIFDCMCGKRFAPTLKSMLPLLEKHGEMNFSGEVKEKLLAISSATIDRLLSAEKKKMRLKGRSHTKPGTL